MATRENWARTPPTRRGSLKAVSQHKATADGYAAPQGERTTNIHQEATGTGHVDVPGLACRSGRASRRGRE